MESLTDDILNIGQILNTCLKYVDWESIIYFG